jgi:hypothetical protein
MQVRPRAGPMALLRPDQWLIWATWYGREILGFAFDRGSDKDDARRRAKTCAALTNGRQNIVLQRIATLSVIVVLCAAARPALAQSADIVALNGKVFTARDGAQPVQGFAVKGEKFIAVGSTEAMRAQVGANTRVIDLAGRFVVPGLADGHSTMRAAATASMFQQRVRFPTS